MSLSGSIFYEHMSALHIIYFSFFGDWVHLDVIIHSSLYVLKINGQSIEKLAIDVNDPFVRFFVFATSICCHRKDDLIINPVYTFTTKQERK